MSWVLITNVKQIEVHTQMMDHVFLGVEPLGYQEGPNKQNPLRWGLNLVQLQCV